MKIVCSTVTTYYTHLLHIKGNQQNIAFSFVRFILNCFECALLTFKLMLYDYKMMEIDWNTKENIECEN